MTELQTPRLRLRRFTLNDAPFILRHVNEPSWIENIRDSGIRTLEDARRYLLDGPVSSYERFGFGLLLIELLETGEPVGMCGLLQRADLPAPDLGFSIDPGHRGQGLATEAAGSVLEWGWETAGLQEILAIVTPGNQASMYVLERLGFEAEGEMDLGGKTVQRFIARRV